MALDDLALAIQRAVDRVVRRLRRGAPPAPGRPRFLIVQIDGLSRAALEEALRARYMPFLARLLARHRYRLEPMAVGIPTSTPAFQMSAMYGVRPDIPGFHYYDRQRRADIHFPRPGHAALVEARQAGERPGILAGGSSYGCVFTGGADNNLFSFARMTRPTGRGLVCALSPFVVTAWVVVKSLVQTALEVARAVLRLVANPAGEQGWRWLTIQIAISVWLRGFFTLAVSRDLYAGVPAIYVNYVDYDVAGHAFGPRSRRALRTLRRLDSAIRQLVRVARRVPEHAYDIYVLSDHGQAQSVPFRDVAGGRRFERWMVDEFFASARSRNSGSRRSGLVRGIGTRRRGASGLFQHFVNYLDEGFLRRAEGDTHEEGGIRVISAGPNAFVYVLDAGAPLDADGLERRFPGMAEELSRQPGVGFVLARAPVGAVCFWRGTRYWLGNGEPGPFAGREDAALVIEGLVDLMAMPSAGDMVLYGTDAPPGHVSFIPEVGAHAGPSPEELHTVIVRPEGVRLPVPLTHPVQLYDHFLRYASGSSRPEPTPGAERALR